ncbi:MAG TPA: DUF4416 family protein [Candidatus Pacearchaeota archaeon]|nr:DUF4416 family protein [Candidatus Pacearchaeota archaeon]
MGTRYIIKKQLSYIPCRFILGVIAPSRELTPEINPDFLNAVEKGFKVEDLLPTQTLPNSPESYVEETGEPDLSTLIFVLKERGNYTDLHHMKRRTGRLERQFMRSPAERIFNVNPGAVGTYGLCLASHKPTGDRHDLSTYAYGSHPQLLFGEDSFYERIMEWNDGRLELVGRAIEEGKFPEYSGQGRVAKFASLVRSLPKSDIPVELMADRLNSKTHSSAIF